MINTGNEIGTEGAKALGDGLEANSTLRELDLCGLHKEQNFKMKNNNVMMNSQTANKIGTEGIKWLSEKVRTNLSLREIDLGGEKWTAHRKKKKRKEVMSDNIVTLNSK